MSAPALSGRHGLILLSLNAPRLESLDTSFTRVCRVKLVSHHPFPRRISPCSRRHICVSYTLPGRNISNPPQSSPFLLPVTSPPPASACACACAPTPDPAPALAPLRAGIELCRHEHGELLVSSNQRRHRTQNNDPKAPNAERGLEHDRTQEDRSAAAAPVSFDLMPLDACLESALEEFCAYAHIHIYTHTGTGARTHKHTRGRTHDNTNSQTPMKPAGPGQELRVENGHATCSASTPNFPCQFRPLCPGFSTECFVLGFRV